MKYALHVAPPLRDELVAVMKQEPYSLSLDAFNNTGISKMNLLTVRIDNVNQKDVSQKILDLCLTTGVDASKPKEVFETINSTLELYEIPWNLCSAFGIDNSNSNIGTKNSIKPRVTEVNPSIYFIVCSCHTIRNAAQ